MGESAFYANFGRHPNIFNIPKGSPGAETAIQEVN